MSAGDPLPASEPGPGEGRTRWSRIFEGDLLYRDRCWETCGGGYCCKPLRVQRNFAFLRRDGVELPLLPGEYHFLTRRGLMQRGFPEALTRHRVQLLNGECFPIYRTVCRLDGVCSNHAFRPLVCRLYPVAPVPDLEGRVERFEPIALIDLYWGHLARGVNPCTIQQLTPTETARFEEVSAELFLDPVNIFYMKAASLYRQALLEGVLTRHPRLLELPQDEFFSAWERYLVMGKLYRPADLMEALTSLYEALREQWGEAFSFAHLQGNEA